MYIFAGGFKLELLDSSDEVLQLLTPAGAGSKKDDFVDDDTTQQSFSVTLPTTECLNCSVRGRLQLRKVPAFKVHVLKPPPPFPETSSLRFFYNGVNLQRFGKVGEGIRGLRVRTQYLFCDISNISYNQ